MLLLVGIAVSALVFHAQGQPPQAAHRFQQIAPGVYSAIATGTLNVGSNSCVIAFLAITALSKMSSRSVDTTTPVLTLDSSWPDLPTLWTSCVTCLGDMY